jgi:hypothetical protein
MITLETRTQAQKEARKLRERSLTETPAADLSDLDLLEAMTLAEVDAKWDDENGVSARYAECRAESDRRETQRQEATTTERQRLTLRARALLAENPNMLMEAASRCDRDGARAVARFMLAFDGEEASRLAAFAHATSMLNPRVCIYAEDYRQLLAWVKDFSGREVPSR